MLQNRSSSAESAHANTEASVSGHCLDSSGKSMKCVSKKEKNFPSQKEKGTWNIFENLELDLEFFVQEEQPPVNEF